jgi:hypothetical protein
VRHARSQAGLIHDREIVGCALHVMDRYGDAAWFHAAQRADELLDRNDLAGHGTWLRILARIEELQTVPAGRIQ